jgi:hypothetical protein
MTAKQTVLDMMDSEEDSECADAGQEIMDKVSEPADTASNLESVLGDIHWTRGAVPGSYKKRYKFVEDYLEGLRTTNLSGRAKALIVHRYLRLFSQYEDKYRNSKRAHLWSRLFVAIGSILTTALIAVDSDIADRNAAAQALYYTSFVTSVCVTGVNACSELLQLGRRFYTNATTYNNLQQEGWAFLIKRGRYKAYKDHKSCWHLFIRQAEKYHQSAAFASLAHIKSNEGGKQGGAYVQAGDGRFDELGGRSGDSGPTPDHHRENDGVYGRWPWYMVNEADAASQMNRQVEEKIQTMPEIFVQD